MPRTTNVIAASLESNLDSLANNAAKVVGSVDLDAAGAHELGVYVQAQLAAAGVSADGQIELWCIYSHDNIAWTDGIDVASLLDVSAALSAAVRLKNAPANVNADLVKMHAEIYPGAGGGYKYACVVIYNKSGAALDAAGNAVNYAAVVYS
ncbi:MAG TPA: hypothetical protein ENJ17_01075 [Gammaproteobacteria bacterium]|nr:hypothetical protein [Gammaproteobacteria bacterium]